MTYLRVLRMRRVVRILCLLCDQSWVELLVAVNVSRVDVLRWLAAGLLGSVSSSHVTKTGIDLPVAELELTASAGER